MTRFLVAAMIVIISLGVGTAQETAPPISPAQFQKLTKAIETIGGKEELPAPTAHDLGLSSDASLALPVLLVVTDDHHLYFGRSQLNQNDYIVWVRAERNKASYMFSTHSDLKLIGALYLRNDQFPRAENINSQKIQGIYRDALAALARDIDKSMPH